MKFWARLRGARENTGVRAWPDGRAEGFQPVRLDMAFNVLDAYWAENKQEQQ